MISSPPASGRQSKSDEVAASTDLVTLQALNLKATEKLTEIIRRSNGGEIGWQGYSQAELIAAKELLDRDAMPLTR